MREREKSEGEEERLSFALISAGFVLMSGREACVADSFARSSSACSEGVGGFDLGVRPGLTGALLPAAPAAVTAPAGLGVAAAPAAAATAAGSAGLPSAACEERGVYACVSVCVVVV